MIRLGILSLGGLLLGFPLCVAASTLLGRICGLDPAQTVYAAMLLGPLSWAGLYVGLLWHLSPESGGRP